MKRDYTPEEIERALQTRATLGSSIKASEALEEIGSPVPRQTLDRWVRDTHRDRYLEIRVEEAPRIAKTVASQLEDQLPQAMRVKQQMYDKLEAELPDLKPGELSKTIRDISVDTAVTIDKINVLRGQPTELVEHKHHWPQIDQAITVLLDQAKEKQKAIDVQSVELEEGEQG